MTTQIQAKLDNYAHRVIFEPILPFDRLLKDNECIFLNTMDWRYDTCVSTGAYFQASVKVTTLKNEENFFYENGHTRNAKADLLLTSTAEIKKIKALSDEYAKITAYFKEFCEVYIGLRGGSPSEEVLRKLAPVVQGMNIKSVFPSYSALDADFSANFSCAGIPVYLLELKFINQQKIRTFDTAYVPAQCSLPTIELNFSVDINMSKYPEALTKLENPVPIIRHGTIARIQLNYVEIIRQLSFINFVCLIYKDVFMKFTQGK